MKNLYSRLGVAAMVGLCLLPRVSSAYVIPILSLHENRTSNIALMIESEITRWKQEALKYREMLYTDILGKEGSLGNNKIISKVEEAAKDGAAAIQNAETSLKHVSNLSDYSSAKSNLERYYTVDPNKGLEYTTREMEEILESQRVAINEMAKDGIALAAVDTVWASINSGESDPEERSKEMAKAKDMNAMYELMLGLDRANYERALRISSVEAADASIRAMQALQGLARNAGSKIGNK